jgi:hypothetical protein
LAFRKAPLKTIGLLTRGWVFVRALVNVLEKRTAAALHRLGERKLEERAVSLPLDVVEQIAALARRRVRASWQEWISGLARSLLSVAMVASVCLAGLNAYNRRWVDALVFVAGAALVLVLARVVRRRYGDSFADYLLRVARELEQILEPEHAVRYIVLGHDHRVAMERMKQAWYVNAGTWVRVFRQGGPIEGREEPTFFRHFCGHKGAPEVLCWDDAAGAPARVAFGLDAQ